MKKEYNSKYIFSNKEVHNFFNNWHNSKYYKHRKFVHGQWKNLWGISIGKLSNFPNKQQYLKNSEITRKKLINYANSVVVSKL